MKQEPSQLKVETVLNAYIESYHEAYWRRAESVVLVPNSLNLENFRQLRQNDSKSEIVNTISEKLADFHKSFKTDSNNVVETIIAGFDSEGAHLYQLYFDDVEIATNIGYAAIGVGKMHADSHFQLNHYTSNWRYGDALFLLYEAKKKADNTPARSFCFQNRVRVFRLSFCRRRKFRQLRLFRLMYYLRKALNGFY